MGFKIVNNSIKGYAKNSGGYELIDLDTLNAGAIYSYECLLEGTAVKFYLNNVLKGTASTYAPTGLSDSSRIFYIYISTSANENKTLEISYYDFIQYPAS
ncbi:MAG: hypothetical protein ACM3WV_12435 [Bacillota bacterium]